MITEKTPKLYLSRRNLIALLSKLDRDNSGEDTACTIIKHQSKSSAYRQTMKTIAVIAVQDEDYYGALARPAGMIHPLDEKKLHKPETGVECSGPIL